MIVDGPRATVRWAIVQEFIGSLEAVDIRFAYRLAENDGNWQIEIRGPAQDREYRITTIPTSVAVEPGSSGEEQLADYELLSDSVVGIFIQVFRVSLRDFNRSFPLLRDQATQASEILAENDRGIDEMFSEPPEPGITETELERQRREAQEEQLQQLIEELEREEEERLT